jgi:hypothetical protein
MATQRWGDTGLAWSGNSTLNLTRIVSNQVLLDFVAPAVLANTKGLWRMDEAAWAGAANEVVDASGLGRHGQAYSGATTADAWINRGGTFNGSNYALIPSTNDYKYGLNDPVTYEAWFKFTGAPAANKDLCGFYGTPDGFVANAMMLATSSTAITGWMRFGINGNNTTLTPVYACSPQDNAWHHMALETWVVSGTRYAQVFFNGVGGTVVSGVAKAPDATAAHALGARWAGTTATAGDFFIGLVDEVRWTLARVYNGTNFAPVRFPAAGTVIGGNNPLVGTLTGVSWNATESGDNEGDVSAVEVWTGGAWTAVGGASPTSPITGLSLPVGTGNLLRFTLAPKADALKSETPLLAWAEATVAQGSAARAHNAGFNAGFNRGVN